MKDRTSIRYNNGKCVCPKCRGDLAYDGTARERLPIGIGFRGGKFVIDSVERRGFIGECMECFTKVFAIKTQVTRSTHPLSINNKIKAAAVKQQQKGKQ